MKLIDIRGALDPRGTNRVRAILGSRLESILAVSRLNDIYTGLDLSAPERSFFRSSLEFMGVDYDISPEDLEKIPAAGPLLVVANHPFGGIEGLVLGDILTRRRQDTKLLGNYLLQRIPELGPYIIPVDPFGGSEAARSNIRGLKASIRHLISGGVLGAFPAGEVAHLALSRRQSGERVWSQHIGALVRHSQATVTPVYFPGRNSALFNLLGLLDPRLRTAMLPRELVNKRNRRLSVLVGRPIPWSRLEQFESDRELADYLRLSTLILGNRVPARPKRVHGFRFARTERPVATARPAEAIAAELAALPSDSFLAEDSEFAVYAVQREQAPALIEELGRLREITFRQIGEGTGKSSDLDRFDNHYIHLVLWHKAAAEVAGAYRLGLADRLIARQGRAGLYSGTLFRFGPEFLSRLDNAIELGRSFIRREYQRHPSSLALLWRGIGELVCREPWRCVLFGPVSISRDYHAVSRRLIVQFLSRNRLDPDLSRLVRPRKPFRIAAGALEGGSLRDIEDVSMLVSELEADGKGVPVLIKHYLRLNASLLSFNVDRKFSDVVDGLIRVDLRTTDPRILSRFMGRHGFARFAEHHGLERTRREV
ncbi:lysophospholipid acyltransferase family protein [bacterium]|nr:lysophospholipid acyltransferase family protein [bacterium]